MAAARARRRHCATAFGGSSRHGRHILPSELDPKPAIRLLGELQASGPQLLGPGGLFDYLVGCNETLPESAKTLSGVGLGPLVGVELPDS
jgi:hypothetical protein